MRMSAEGPQKGLYKRRKRFYRKSRKKIEAESAEERRKRVLGLMGKPGPIRWALRWAGWPGTAARLEWGIGFHPVSYKRHKTAAKTAIKPRTMRCNRF